MVFLKRNKILDTNQHGFVKGKSCTTNLLEALDIITNAKEEGFPIDLLFTDFLKAFDKVNHRFLLSKLEKYGIRGKLLDWFRDFL